MNNHSRRRLPCSFNGGAGGSSISGNRGRFSRTKAPRTSVAIILGCWLVAVGGLLFSGCASGNASKLWSRFTASMSKTGVADGANDAQARELDPTAQASSNLRIVDLEFDDDFTQIIRQTPGVVLVDFHADWCGPCQRQGKILNDVAADQPGNALIVKVNVDDHRDLADSYQIKGLPTLLVFKDGELLKRQTGLVNRRQISSFLAM